MPGLRRLQRNGPAVHRHAGQFIGFGHREHRPQRLDTPLGAVDHKRPVQRVFLSRRPDVDTARTQHHAPERPVETDIDGTACIPVSYTHLTLPTSDLV